MTSLVTGGNGFIGHQLVRALVERGENVVVFDVQDREDLLHPLGDRVTFVQGDLAELVDVCTVVEHYRPQTIFHLGALISLAAEMAPQRAFRVNLGGTFNLLEAAKLFDVETLVMRVRSRSMALESSRQSPMMLRSSQRASMGRPRWRANVGPSNTIGSTGPMSVASASPQ